MENVYHQPVMLKECVEALNISPEKVYVDLTFGGGGHSKVILEQLGSGKLVAFDQDEDAKAVADTINDQRLIFVAANFKHLRNYLRMNQIKKVDGILADLGISSHQIDEAERGFSTRFSGRLDMRMDKQADLSAREVVNEYSEENLRKIFYKYGELKNGGRIAEAIVRQRISKPINDTTDLITILERFAERGKEFRFYAQAFQAIRIEVNDELGALEQMLLQVPEVLNEGGRLVVMSYHSLEDRLVKNFIKTGKLEGDVEKDFYGNLIRPLEPLHSKPIVASEEEIVLNRRARSAKLRIAQKI